MGLVRKATAIRSSSRNEPSEQADWPAGLVSMPAKPLPTGRGSDSDVVSDHWREAGRGY